MEKVEFENKEYVVKEIKLPRIGNVYISTTSLNDALMYNGNDYVSVEAQKIDEMIYFFVEENEIEMNEEDLIKLVIRETA